MAQLAKDNRQALVKKRTSLKLRDSQSQLKKAPLSLTSKMTKIALAKHFGLKPKEHIILTDPDPPPIYIDSSLIKRDVFIKMLIIPLISICFYLRVLADKSLKFLKNVR